MILDPSAMLRTSLRFGRLEKKSLTTDYRRLTRICGKKQPENLNAENAEAAEIFRFTIYSFQFIITTDLPPYGWRIFTDF